MGSSFPERVVASAAVILTMELYIVGRQIVVVPVVKPTQAPQYTNDQVCYIQQPAVAYHNFMAQQYNWPNLQTGLFYYCNY